MFTGPKKVFEQEWNKEGVHEVISLEGEGGV